MCSCRVFVWMRVMQGSCSGSSEGHRATKQVLCLAGIVWRMHMGAISSAYFTQTVVRRV